jgi:CDP-diglyceride synthetase
MIPFSLTKAKFCAICSYDNSFIHLPSGLLILFHALPGIADVVGRRLGKEKLPHNPNKSYAGSIAMTVAGFLASIG